MSNEQKSIFSKMLDLNYDAKYETDLVKKTELIRQLNEQEALLEESMGAAEYSDFIRRGRQLFAPSN